MFEVNILWDAQGVPLFLSTETWYNVQKRPGRKERGSMEILASTAQMKELDRIAIE